MRLSHQQIHWLSAKAICIVHTKAAQTWWQGTSAPCGHGLLPKRVCPIDQCSSVSWERSSSGWSLCQLLIQQTKESHIPNTHLSRPTPISPVLCGLNPTTTILHAAPAAISSSTHGLYCTRQDSYYLPFTWKWRRHTTSSEPKQKLFFWQLRQKPLWGEGAGATNYHVSKFLPPINVLPTPTLFLTQPTKVLTSSANHSTPCEHCSQLTIKAT